MFNLSTHTRVAFPATVTDPRPYCIERLGLSHSQVRCCRENIHLSLMGIELCRLTHNQ
jgi:hypothetical protein